MEIEATVRPSRSFSVGGAVTYQKAVIDVDGLNCPTEFQTTTLLIPVGGTQPINTCFRFQSIAPSGATVTSGFVQNVRSGKLPAAPRWRFNVSPRWEAQISARLNGFIQADLSYQSEQQFAVEQDPDTIQEGYALVDMSIGLRDPDSRYMITAFAKNLFDHNYYTTFGTTALISTKLSVVDVTAFRPKNADRYFVLSFASRF